MVDLREFISRLRWEDAKPSAAEDNSNSGRTFPTSYFCPNSAAYREAGGVREFCARRQPRKQHASLVPLMHAD